METKTHTQIYEVTVPDCRKKFEMWIAERKGVMVWTNQDLGNMDRGDMFAPFIDENGQEYGKPHWAYALKEVVHDIKRFKFVKELKEVQRVKIALNPRLNGLRIDLNAASSRRVRKAAAKLKEKHGVEPSYHFEDLECVFTIPIWE